ncbi:MAG: hypothetical protein FJ102_00675 [Deltaproteobacteria bacterium]|nr:hypothetical protein [Deltaproteobacteria bacterium]
MSLVLDAGALVAIERADRGVLALLKRELLAGRAPVTHGGVVGQVWRSGSGRQANLARLLRGVEVRALDGPLGCRAGELLGIAGEDDVIDAAVALLALDGDMILTSDPGDLAALVAAAGTHADIVPV